MTLRDAYRNQPANATQAAGMLNLIREHIKHGLNPGGVMDTTNTRIAYLRGYLDAAHAS